MILYKVGLLSQHSMMMMVVLAAGALKCVADGLVCQPRALLTWLLNLVLNNEPV